VANKPGQLYKTVLLKVFGKSLGVPIVPLYIAIMIEPFMVTWLE
jgi:hypothetical protein